MITCKFSDKTPVLLRHVTVDALCIRDTKVVLVKRAANFSEGGKWAIPGGFLDQDETTQQGALRELLEETGYTGTIIELFKLTSNPYRGKEDRQNVNFTYLVKPSEKIQDSDHEIMDVQWFDLEFLPKDTEVAFDHYDILQNYKQWMDTSFKLPIIV